MTGAKYLEPEKSSTGSNTLAIEGLTISDTSSGSADGTQLTLHISLKFHGPKVRAMSERLDRREDEHDVDFE